MGSARKRTIIGDPIWQSLRTEAQKLAGREPALASFVHTTVLNHARLEDALSYHLARKIGGSFLSPMLVRELIQESLDRDPAIGQAVRADLAAVRERNPACRSHLETFLFFKGFHALEAWRTAHWLWRQQRRSMALLFQSRISQLFAVDIHPAAKLGSGIMIDHACGVVIGETAVVEDDVSMLHGVTLGGTGKDAGDRHPKVRRGVLLSVGASLLGNIEIGEHARVGAGSVVLKAVPQDCSAVGVPARLVNCRKGQHPSEDMDQLLDPEAP
jgi:serine O-acetyltransferase